MKLNKTAGIALVVVLIAAVAGFWLGSRQGRQLPDDPVAVRALLAAPFLDLAGQTRQLNALPASVLVVNFWATWCPPCREEMPVLSKVARKYADKGVTFVGIALDEHDKVEAFARATPVSYPLWLADTGAVSLSVPLGNEAQGLPFTAVISRDGKLVMTKLGAVTEAELEAALQPLQTK